MARNNRTRPPPLPLPDFEFPRRENPRPKQDLTEGFELHASHQGTQTCLIEDSSYLGKRVWSNSRKPFRGSAFVHDASHAGGIRCSEVEPGGRFNERRLNKSGRGQDEDGIELREMLKESCLPGKLPVPPQGLSRAEPDLDENHAIAKSTVSSQHLSSSPRLIGNIPSQTPQGFKTHEHALDNSHLANDLLQAPIQSQPRFEWYPMTTDSVEGSLAEGSTVEKIYTNYGKEGNLKGALERQISSSALTKSPELNRDFDAADIKARDRSSRLSSLNPYKNHNSLSSQYHVKVDQVVAENIYSTALDLKSISDDMSDQAASDEVPSTEELQENSTLKSLPHIEFSKSIRRQSQKPDSPVRLDGHLPDKLSIGTIRRPLEVDISKALRYHSGLSMGSLNNPAESRESQLESEYHAMMHSKSNLDQKIRKTVDNVATNVGSQSRPDQRHYNPNSVQEDGNKSITVPLSQIQPSASTSSVISESIVVGASEYTEDGGDWETVVDSHTNLRNLAVTGPSYLPQAKRCGDSIADVSDEGNLDFDLETNAFPSTERVTLHPANGTYQGKYRQRFVHRGNTPVLLPSGDEHKVNGYSADSSRIRPRLNHFHSSPPLKESHKHPFKSTPPESMSPIGKKFKASHLFPRQSRIKAAYFEDTDQTDWVGDLDPAAGSSNHATMASSPRAFGGHPGSAAAYGTNGWQLVEHNHVRASSPGQESSIQSLQNFHTDGLTEPMIKGRIGDAVFLQRPTAAHTKSKFKASGSRPFFHQSNEKKVRSPVKVFAAEREERPEVFLNDDPSTLTITESGRDPHGPVFMENLFYNDPRAPIRNENWQQLYPEEELTRVQTGGSVTGRPVRPSRQVGLSNGVKRLDQPPQILRKSKFPRYAGNLGKKQKDWSNFVFWICILALPLSFGLLPAYATGHLDWLIRSTSEGLIECFTNQRKRHALYATLIYWILAIIVAIVTGIVFAVKHGHN